MSAGISTVPAVQARLLELFKAAVEASTTVWPNRPNEDYDLAENVFLGDVRGEREFRNIGGTTPHQREEDYSVAVDVAVYRQGTDGQGTEERAWEILAALEKAIAEEPKLGFTGGFQPALVERFESKSRSGTDGWLVELTVDVAIKARI